MTYGVIPRARRARTMPKKPGSPEARTTVGPGCWPRASRASSRCLSSMRSAVSGMGAALRCRGAPMTVRASARASVASGPNGRPSQPITVTCWLPRAHPRGGLGDLLLAGEVDHDDADLRGLRFRAAYLGAEPAQHAGGAGAQLAACRREQAGLVPEFGRVPGGVGVADLPGQVLGAAGGSRDVGQQGQVHLGPRVVGHQHARGQLGELARHAGEDDVAEVVLGRPAQRGAGEVAHLHEAHLRQLREELHGALLGAAAGAQHHRVLALGGQHRDRLLHAGPPGRGGERPDDAGGAEDRDTADDAEPGVGGLARHPLAVRDRDDDRDSALGQVDGLADGLGDHRAGHRVDGRAAQLEPEARLGDHAHAHAAVQLEARLAAPAHGGGQPRAVGHVGVVTGVLDHHGLGFGLVRPCIRPRGSGPAGHPAGRPPRCAASRRVQRGGGRLGRGGRAGPGGPAGAQRLLPHLRRPRQVGLAQLGIGLTLCRSFVSRSCFLAWGSAFRYPWKWPGWYRCERLPAVCSPGPTRTSVCFQSLRSFMVAARVSSVVRMISSSGQVTW